MIRVIIASLWVSSLLTLCGADFVPLLRIVNDTNDVIYLADIECSRGIGSDSIYVGDLTPKTKSLVFTLPLETKGVTIRAVRTQKVLQFIASPLPKLSAGEIYQFQLSNSGNSMVVVPISNLVLATTIVAARPALFFENGVSSVKGVAFDPIHAMPRSVAAPYGDAVLAASFRDGFTNGWFAGRVDKPVLSFELVFQLTQRNWGDGIPSGVDPFAIPAPNQDVKLRQTIYDAFRDGFIAGREGFRQASAK